MNFFGGPQATIGQQYRNRDITMPNLDRLTAHISDPETYYAPTIGELQAIRDELRDSRKFADLLYKSIMGGGETVTFSKMDIDVIARLAGRK